jgi:hypothetical protein
MMRALCELCTPGGERRPASLPRPHRMCTPTITRGVGTIRGVHILVWPGRRRRPTQLPTTLALVAAMLLSLNALADVDLVTVPTRESTQLTIYNSEDITMVREQRLLTVKPGINRIQFSWANTLIDSTSIDFRILGHMDKVDLLDTTFPAGRNDALQWNLSSTMAGQLPVEIRYFTSGITWKADYAGLANEEETELDLTGYVRVYNNSGELYDNAEVRLVVGKINLVEKIAELASRPAPDIPALERSNKSKADAFGDAVLSLDVSGNVSSFANTPQADAPAEAKKQGLSEYFLFAIAGRQDIKNAEPKRLVSMSIEDVPLESIYKLSDRSNPNQFTKYYRFENKELADADLPDMENLGVAPLPDGMVRLYSEYANRDLAYVGGTETKYVPIGDRVEVNVGLDSDITMMRRLKDTRIDGVVARQYKRRLNDIYVLYYDLIDYEETFYYEEEITSGKAVDVEVEVERRFDAKVVLWGSDGKPADWDSNEPGAYVDLHEVESRIEKVDQNHVKYFLDIKPGQKWTVAYSVTYKRRKIGPELNTQKVREPR